jgi:hypothetical protein
MDAPGRYEQNPPLRGEAEPPLREVEGSRSSQCNTRVFGSLPSLSGFAHRLPLFPPPLSTRVHPSIFFCSATAFSLALPCECVYSVASFAVAVCFIPMFAKRAHEVSETLEDPDPALPCRSRTGIHYRKRRQ